MICVSDDGGCRTEGRVMVGNAVGGEGEYYRLRSRAASVSADILRSDAKNE